MVVDYHFPIQVSETTVVIPSHKSTTTLELSMVDRRLDSIITYIPYRGSERICWECKRERYVMIVMDLFGKHTTWGDICHPFEDA